MAKMISHIKSQVLFEVLSEEKDYYIVVKSEEPEIRLRLEKFAVDGKMFQLEKPQKASKAKSETKANTATKAKTPTKSSSKTKAKTPTKPKPRPKPRAPRTRMSEQSA